MKIRFSISALFLMSVFSAETLAFDADKSILTEPGKFRAIAAAGISQLDREWYYGTDASLRIGIASRVEFAAPLAMGILLASTDQGSGLVLVGGVSDAWVAPNSSVLWAPTLALAAQARTASSASFRVSFDLTGFENGFSGGEHPGWFRGAFGLLIDVGPYLTIAGGFSYQRLVFGEGRPEEARQPGWVGDARFSIGGVRTHPFESLPTIAIHISRGFDIIALIRGDFDNDTKTGDLRLLAGVRIMN